MDLDLSCLGAGFKFHPSGTIFILLAWKTANVLRKEVTYEGDSVSTDQLPKLNTRSRLCQEGTGGRRDL